MYLPAQTLRQDAFYRVPHRDIALKHVCKMWIVALTISVPKKQLKLHLFVFLEDSSSSANPAKTTHNAKVDCVNSFLQDVTAHSLARASHVPSDTNVTHGNIKSFAKRDAFKTVIVQMGIRVYPNDVNYQSKSPKERSVRRAKRTMTVKKIDASRMTLCTHTVTAVRLVAQQKAVQKEVYVYISDDKIYA